MWHSWELRRLFGHVYGTADVTKVLKNDKRMVADLVKRVEGGIFLRRMCCLPSRTSWTKKNTTREVPCFVRDALQFAPAAFFRFSVACGIWVRCRNARSSKARGLFQSVLALCMTKDQLSRFALHAPPDEILAMCDRRGDDAVCLHMAECVQQAFNGLGDPTPTVLAMIFASALLKSSVRSYDVQRRPLSGSHCIR